MATLENSVLTQNAITANAGPSQDYRLASPHPLKPRPRQQPVSMHICCRRTQTVDAQSGRPVLATQTSAHLPRITEQLNPSPAGGCERVVVRSPGATDADLSPLSSLCGWPCA